jgi:hypothetical protein
MLALLLLPTAQAHEEPGFGHLTVDVADLAPGQTKSYHLDPSNDEGMITLSKGWVFGVYGGLQGNGTGRLNVFLYHEGVSVANWTWLPGYHANTTRLYFTGEYEIRVQNPGNQTARYALYYDQSCNCKGKLIPLPGGWNLFNYDLPAGRKVELGFPLMRNAEVRGSLATLESATDARWPQDFTVLKQAQTKGPEWLNFTFIPARAQRYYVYVEAVQGAQIDSPLYLTPLLEVEPKSSGAPAPSASAFILVIGLVLAIPSRRV